MTQPVRLNSDFDDITEEIPIQEVKTAVIDAVIDVSSDARLFPCSTSSVMTRQSYLDFLKRFDHSETVSINLGQPVPVIGLDSIGPAIGFANLKWEGDNIKADLTIDYHSGERLLIQTDSDLYLTPILHQPTFDDILHGRDFVTVSLLFVSERKVDDGRQPIRGKDA